MRATVYGGRGFVGTHVAARLRNLGWEVILPSRNEVPSCYQGSVFYCAGMTADYASRPYETIEAHVSLLKRVLERGDFDSLVYASSTRLYDGCLASPCTEKSSCVVDPHNPRHLFDLSKLLGESLCITASGGRAKIARLSNVYGDSTMSTGFLDKLLETVRRSRGNGDSVVNIETSLASSRDYVHVDDVVDLLLKIAHSGNHATYNVASGTCTTNAALFDAIERAYEVRVMAYGNQSPNESPRIAIERAQSEFAWQFRNVISYILESS